MTTIDHTPVAVSGAGPPEPLPPLLLRQVASGPLRVAALRLLNPHDGPRPPDADGLEEPCLYALTDVAADLDDVPAAAALVVSTEPGTEEVAAVGADPALPHRRVLARLLVDIADRLRAGGSLRLVVGSAVEGIDDAVLADAGFRSRQLLL